MCVNRGGISAGLWDLYEGQRKGYQKMVTNGEGVFGLISRLNVAEERITEPQIDLQQLPGWKRGKKSRERSRAGHPRTRKMLM